MTPIVITYEPVHEISNKVVCVTSKASDQPAHMHSLIRAFSSHFVGYDLGPTCLQRLSADRISNQRVKVGVVREK